MPRVDLCTWQFRRRGIAMLNPTNTASTTTCIIAAASGLSEWHAHALPATDSVRFKGPK
jgi:hypothetical protein